MLPCQPVVYIIPHCPFTIHNQSVAVTICSVTSLLGSVIYITVDRSFIVTVASHIIRPAAKHFHLQQCYLESLVSFEVCRICLDGACIITCVCVCVLVRVRVRVQAILSSKRGFRVMLFSLPLNIIYVNVKF